MSTFINTIDTLGDDAVVDSIIDKSITEYKDNNVTVIGKQAFRSCILLNEVNCPNVLTLDGDSFYQCSGLKKVYFKSLTQSNDEAFTRCSNLTYADFSSIVKFGMIDFRYCSKLESLILRSKDGLSTFGSSMLLDSGIASGKGYIYVPVDLLEEYKTTSGWSTYANQIRAIEDYPEVCSLFGKEWYSGGEFYTMVGGNINLRYLSHNKNGVWIGSQGGYGTGIYYSTDGTDWKRSNIKENNWITGTINNTFIAVSSKGIYYSTDGNNWTQSNITGNAVIVSNYNEYDETFAAYNNAIYSSSDGITWNKCTDVDFNIITLYYLNNILFATGNNGVYYSTDGTNWTQSNITKSYAYSYMPQAMVYDNNMWMFVSGNDYKIYYSTDGANWTQCSSRRSYCVKYFNGVWILGAYNGGIYYSTDNGITWNQSNITTDSINKFACIDYIVVAAGYNGIYYSFDGITWNQSNVTIEANDVVYDEDNKIMVAGCKSHFYYSKS